MSRNQDEKKPQGIVANIALDQSYLQIFSSSFIVIFQQLTRGNYAAIPGLLDGIWAVLPPWIRKDFPKQPSKDVKERIADLKKYSYSNLDIGPDALFARKYSRLNEFDRGNFVIQRKNLIIHQCAIEHLEKFTDAFSDAGILLRIDTRDVAGERKGDYDNWLKDRLEKAPPGVDVGAGPVEGEASD